MEGETLGNYRLLQKIGEGGMGAVYLAEHVHLGRKAAVKLLLPEHSQRQELVSRFFNEAKLAASLNHPGIVEILDFGYDARGAAYLVMAFIEGESLTKRVEREGVLSIPEAVELARQIALVISAAHDKGIVHRDLKTDNILLTAPGAGTGAGGFQVKILDFGIAKLTGGSPLAGTSKATSTGMILGTPLFMAPEQCRGSGTIDHRADVYSLGCILFMLLVGRPPFSYEGVGELLAAHLHQPPPAPSTLRGDVPAWLDDVVVQTLQKDPAARPQTMAALAAALDAGRSGPQVLARASGGGPRTTLLPAGASVPGATMSPTGSTFRGAAVDTGDLRPARGGGGLKWALVGGVVVAAAAGGLFVWRAKIAGSPTGTPPSAVNPAAAIAPPPAATPAAGPEPAVAPGPKPTAAPEPKPAVAPEPKPTAAATPDAASVAVAAATDEPATPPESPATPETPTGATAASKPAKPDPHLEPKKPRPGPRPGKPEKTDDESAALYARGLNAIEQRRPVDAIQAFRSYMQRTSGNSPQRLEAGRLLSSLQRTLAELTVTCDVTGARVTVNDIWVGTTPLSQTIWVKPGRHVLQVNASGYKPWQKAFQLSAGQNLPVKVHVER